MKLYTLRETNWTWLADEPNFNTDAEGWFGIFTSNEVYLVDHKQGMNWAQHMGNHPQAKALCLTAWPALILLLLNRRANRKHILKFLELRA